MTKLTHISLKKLNVLFWSWPCQGARLCLCLTVYVHANPVCLPLLRNWFSVHLEWGSEREAEISTHTYTNKHPHAHTRVFSKAVQSHAPADTCVVLDSLLFLNRRTCAATDRQILWVPSLNSDCFSWWRRNFHNQLNRHADRDRARSHRIVWGRGKKRCIEKGDEGDYNIMTIHLSSWSHW